MLQHCIYQTKETGFTTTNLPHTQSTSHKHELFLLCVCTFDSTRHVLVGRHFLASSGSQIGHFEKLSSNGT